MGKKDPRIGRRSVGPGAGRIVWSAGTARLHEGYRTHAGRLMMPRGRIDPVRSIATGALAVATMECQWDEYSAGTPQRTALSRGRCAV